MSWSEWNTQDKKNQQQKKNLKEEAVEVLRAETELNLCWKVGPHAFLKYKRSRRVTKPLLIAQLTNIFFGICNSILILLCFSQYCFHVSSVKP